MPIEIPVATFSFIIITALVLNELRTISRETAKGEL